MTINRFLFFVAVVLATIAAVVGFGWLAPDNARDAQEIYFGLLALAVAFGFAGHAA